MDCRTCKERLYPMSPAQPQYIGPGKYLKPICTTCPNYDKIEQDRDIDSLRREVRCLKDRGNRMPARPAYKPTKRYEEYIDA